MGRRVRNWGLLFLGIFFIIIAVFFACDNPLKIIIETDVGGGFPEIHIRQGDTYIPSSGSFDFGGVVLVNGVKSLTFIIENKGTGELNITGEPRILIDSDVFEVTDQPISTI